MRHIGLRQWLATVAQRTIKMGARRLRGGRSSALLGPLQVDGVPPRARRPQAARAARARSSCIRIDGRADERALDAIWPGADPASAARSLQVYVSSASQGARRRGGGAGDGGYVLQLGASIDVLRFEQLLACEGRQPCRSGRQARRRVLLRDALTLWRGLALADLRYEDVTRRARVARLEELRLTTLEERLEATLALGRHAGARPRARGARRRRSPCASACAASSCSRCTASGRQADALGAFPDARTTLSDELGLDPGCRS